MFKEGDYKCNHCSKTVPSYNAFRWHFVKYHKVKDASNDQELYEGFYEMVQDVNVKNAVGQKMTNDRDFWKCNKRLTRMLTKRTFIIM